MPETKNTQPTDTKPETAETKVRRALKEHPCTTAAKLASAAGVGRSTATKILSRWAAEGLAIRTDGKDQSVPVTWAMCDEENDPADERESGTSSLPVPGDSTASAPTTSGDAAADTPKKERLSKGALYELVKEFLQAHPGEEFGPAKIGTELTRSSGAVNNALEKLVTTGLATKTCEAPKRFTSS
jgi:predicted transcriptional regulator